MKKGIVSTVIILLIAGCSPSEETIQKAIEQTEAARPTPTFTPEPTKIPLSDIDLQPILIQEGDLPPGYTASQFRVEELSDDYDGILYQSVEQILELNNGAGGYVIVKICEDDEYCKKLFNITSTEIKRHSEWITTDASAVGEMSIAASIRITLDSGLILMQTSSVEFVRCNTYIEIGMNRADDIYSAIEYAKHLDDRLSKLVCE